VNALENAPSESGASAEAIADAVWDELSTGHTDAGKAGAQMWTDVDAIATDVAGLDGAAMRGTDNAALASVCTEGRLSELDAANLPTDVANVKSDTAAILTDTGTTLDGKIDTIDTNVDSILVDTGTTLDGKVDAIKAITDVLKVKKNAALNNFTFMMVDSADHVTPKTGLTVTCQRSIDGGAFGNCTNATATEIANGWYKVDLTDTDLNGTVIALKFTSAGADATNIMIVTQP